MMPTDPRSRVSAQTLADNILVVDDGADLRSLIQELLEMAGYCVATAANGAEAIRWVERQRPKGIILDLNMPILDGEAVLRVVRAKYGEILPIILVSADPRLADKARFLRATAYVAKPFQVEELLQVLGCSLRAAGRLSASALVDCAM